MAEGGGYGTGGGGAGYGAGGVGTAAGYGGVGSGNAGAGYGGSGGGYGAFGGQQYSAGYDSRGYNGGPQSVGNYGPSGGGSSKSKGKDAAVKATATLAAKTALPGIGPALALAGLIGSLAEATGADAAAFGYAGNQGGIGQAGGGGNGGAFMGSPTSLSALGNASILSSSTGASNTNMQDPYTFGLQKLYSMFDPNFKLDSIPGYTQALDAGLSGVRRQMAAGGYNLSGNELVGLQDYSMRFGLDQYNKSFSNLIGLAGLGNTRYSTDKNFEAAIKTGKLQANTAQQASKNDTLFGLAGIASTIDWGEIFA